MSSLPTLAFKSPNKIFMWYLGNLSTDFKNMTTITNYNFGKLCEEAVMEQ
jgi:hypothetical protein